MPEEYVLLFHRKRCLDLLVNIVNLYWACTTLYYKDTKITNQKKDKNKKAGSDFASGRLQSNLILIWYILKTYEIFLLSITRIAAV